MNNFNFVTGTTKVYHLAGNDWFAVSQNDETVLLVDTDCALPKGDGTLVGLESRWSDGDWNSVDGENGQTLLDYTNKLADKYFSKIKYVIKPTDIYVDCSLFFDAPTNLQGHLHDAYMFPLSYDEFTNCRAIRIEILKNSSKNRDKLKNENDGYCSSSNVWTRTFSGVGGGNKCCAWRLGNAMGDFGSIYGVGNMYCVAPALNLKKSSIIRINSGGEIILKPED